MHRWLLAVLAGACAPRAVDGVPDTHLPSASPTPQEAPAPAPPRIVRVANEELHRACKADSGCVHSAVAEYGTGGCYHAPEHCPITWTADLDGDDADEYIIEWHGGVTVWRADPPQGCSNTIPCAEELLRRGGRDVGCDFNSGCPMVDSFEVVVADAALAEGIVAGRPVVMLTMSTLTYLPGGGEERGERWREVARCDKTCTTTRL